MTPPVFAALPAPPANGATVFSGERTVVAPAPDLPAALEPNTRLKMDGLDFLAMLPEASFPVAFLDPQYRGVLDRLQYGNEGVQRGRRRSSLEQMPEDAIAQFVRGIDRALMPSGHLFLWMDKFHLCQGFRHWLDGTALDVVDLINWHKGRMGMGYRTRRVTEYCVVLQKQPLRAKGVWRIHNIPDTWEEIPDTWKERADTSEHPHGKPIDLQGELIAAVTHSGDYVIDPAAGSFSVMEAAHRRGRKFLGCDLNG